MTARGEFGIIELFRREAAPTRPEVSAGIGDDCAVIDLPGDQCLLVSTDMLLEDVHFLRAAVSPWRLGWKTLAVNVSDVAAMGGEPTAAFLAMGFPRDVDEPTLVAFRDGLLACARRFGVDLLGGDTVASPHGISLCVTILGRAPRADVLRRSGGRPGDVLFVGGDIGASAAGLHLLLHPDLEVDDADREALLAAHLEPVPQVTLGRFLASHHLAHAAIDVSDGVLQDLGHLAEESGLGLEVEADRLPVSPACRRVAERAGLDPVDLALTGGEDYVLAFAVPPEVAEALPAACLAATGCHVTAVGRLVPGDGRRILRAGAWMDGVGGGYDHFAP